MSRLEDLQPNAADRDLGPANIAEGHATGTRRDYANFISIARRSVAETGTFLLLAVRAKLLSQQQAAP
jgi:four helix bundle protein